MLHMMVDIESLDTASSTVICQLGAVVFDDEQYSIVGQRLWCLDWQSQLTAGRTVSEATLRWWLAQGDAARRGMLRRGHDLSSVLQQLHALWRMHRCKRVWANGTDFDIAALTHAYKARLPHSDQPTPWQYNQTRDMRTLRDLVPEQLKNGIPSRAVEHDALEDAMWQARYVMACLYHLRGGFQATHEHHKGCDYQLMQDDVLLHSTSALDGDETHIVVYRDSDGNMFAQPRDRFYEAKDGGNWLRFKPVGD